MNGVPRRLTEVFVAERFPLSPGRWFLRFNDPEVFFPQCTFVVDKFPISEKLYSLLQIRRERRILRIPKDSHDRVDYERSDFRLVVSTRVETLNSLQLSGAFLGQRSDCPSAEADHRSRKDSRR